MENGELQKLKAVSTRDLIELCHAEIFNSLRYGLIVGVTVDALDREKISRACLILELIRKANPL